ncbi:hypothetical protein PQR02_31430 [Paraburkholderia sediminicola]|uniref:Uncharacterized protein n=1 Tax=Paraburkholderia rhynchosiae TaxID=487049 RepID=A0ACC7NJ20_9BURK
MSDATFSAQTMFTAGQLREALDASETRNHDDRRAGKDARNRSFTTSHN